MTGVGTGRAFSKDGKTALVTIPSTTTPNSVVAGSDVMTDWSNIDVKVMADSGERSTRVAVSTVAPAPRTISSVRLCEFKV